ncbi:DNA primase [Enhygromyxa salina]|uniref:DNA primase n=1 Tax=Enhygromyxa salina TaxID=215803 RepID=A0A2S9XFG9_9BACT|nr:DNA primase [Enhygromyxa salina]PRP91613.1 DNA primase [Enhygromyxa salina]
MATIPDQTIEQIREQTDIVDVIGGHVGLKRSGKQFKGLCPFHDEKSPSFYVDPVRRSFKCFGCGVWGDVFDFIQKVEGVGFLASVRTLGARVGVALPDQSTGDLRRAEQRERDRELAYRINGAAAEIYRRLLTDDPLGAAGRSYQRERGIDAETAESFRVGYAPAPEEGGWDTLVRELQARELPLEMAEQLGLVARSQRSGSYYDRFRARLMFPIVQPGGRVLGFSGRVLPAFAETDDGQKAPKYINSPESLLYKKSKTLFGLHAAGSRMRERERGILVEGQIDVVAMHQRGYVETVAPLGTALTKDQCELLARFTDTIVLCFDGDRAGTKAAYAALPLLLEIGMDARIAALDPGEDPDSTTPEKLANLLSRPRPAILWFVDRMIAKGALRSVEAKVKALDALLPLLRHVRRPSARERYADLAADMLEVPVAKMRASVKGEGRSHFLADMPQSAPMRPVKPLPSGQASVTALLVDRPELARMAEREGVLDHVTDERLGPIVRRTIEAAKNGEPRPSAGELLELVDADQRQALHRLFTPDRHSPSFSDEEDPKAALMAAVALCEREVLFIERKRLEQQISSTMARGEQDRARELLAELYEIKAKLEPVSRSRPN